MNQFMFSKSIKNMCTKMNTNSIILRNINKFHYIKFDQKLIPQQIFLKELCQTIINEISKKIPKKKSKKLKKISNKIQKKNK